MSWADFARRRPRDGRTVMAKEWARFKDRNPNAKLVLIDLQPYGSTQVADDEDVLNVGGFTDRVFEIVSLFAKGELDAKHWIKTIQAIELA